MAHSASTFRRFSSFFLLAVGLGGVASNCTAPAPVVTAGPPATTSQLATLAATPITDYSVDVLILKGEKQPNLTLQVTYPRLRVRPGTAPADTAGVQAFNQQAKGLVEGLVREIEAKARDNHRTKTATGLQVSFRAFLLQQGLASVAFTIGQEGTGPRPTTEALGLTFDLRTAKKVQATDFFQQNAAFKTVVLNALKAETASNSTCQPDLNKLIWDNFVLGPEAYYLLLGDAQVGRTCDTRAVRVPLARLQPFAVNNSPAARLKNSVVH